MSIPVEAHPVDVPEGYPRDFEREVWLGDGRRVQVRPIVSQDAAALAEAIRDADADTLRRRFLGGPPHLTRTLLEHLCVLDYQRRFALVAVDPASGRGVAVARFEPAGPGVAEIAVAVDPGWRRVGLATALVELLAEAALRRGIHAFSADYLAANRPVAALLDMVGGLGQRRIREGIGECLVGLDHTPIADAIRDENPPGGG